MNSSGSKDSKCSFNAVNSESQHLQCRSRECDDQEEHTFFPSHWRLPRQTGIWACVTDALVVVTVTSFHCVSIAKLNLHYAQVCHQNLETCVKVSQFPSSYSNLHIQACVRGIWRLYAKETKMGYFKFNLVFHSVSYCLHIKAILNSENSACKQLLSPEIYVAWRIPKLCTKVSVWIRFHVYACRCVPFPYQLRLSLWACCCACALRV